MTDATMVGTVAVEDMTTIAAHLHPTIDVMITDEDLDLDLTHHVSKEFYKDKNTGWLGTLPELAKKKDKINGRQVEQQRFAKNNSS